ncbi:hypothetical protein RND81_07G026600 [Saponaria officinalis]|uniref:Uncharacterized protein n=1 Tax=Saponaria officinalis TaxID=3572 RepID=A0AAW1JKA5_SAPOF
MSTMSKEKMGAEWRLSGCRTKEEKEKEKIFMQGIWKDDEKGCLCSTFYEIDMGNGCVKEWPHVLYHCLNSITSIGSVMYVVGGLPSDMFSVIKPTVDAAYMFYLESDSGWKQIPPYIPPIPDADTKLPFIFPAVVSLGGKIYAFASSTRSPFALVFCPTSNHWDTLLPPSDVGFFDVHSSSSAVADPDNNRLLVHFRSISSIYAYYLSDNTWQLTLDSFTCCAKHMVFVDGVFYVYICHHGDLVMAYDTITKQRLEIVFTSEVPINMLIYKFDDMLYLGNGLMCLTHHIGKSVDSPSPTVNIAKFRFKRSTDRPGVLIITPLSWQTYTINSLCSMLNYYSF